MIEEKVFEYKFGHFENALNTLKNAVIIAKKEDKESQIFSMLRDSCIQRFEYTYELSWKFMKFVLEKYDNEIETRTPKQVIKSAFRAGYLDNIDIWFKLSDYRNKTSHEYEEDVADDLYFQIPIFLEEIQKFYELIKVKYAKGDFK